MNPIPVRLPFLWPKFPSLKETCRGYLNFHSMTLTIMVVHSSVPYPSHFLPMLNVIFGKCERWLTGFIIHFFQDATKNNHRLLSLFIYHMETRYTANLKLLNHIFFFLCLSRTLPLIFRSGVIGNKWTRGCWSPDPILPNNFPQELQGLLKPEECRVVCPATIVFTLFQLTLTDEVNTLKKKRVWQIEITYISLLLWNIYIYIYIFIIVFSSLLGCM